MARFGIENYVHRYVLCIDGVQVTTNVKSVYIDKCIHDHSDTITVEMVSGNKITFPYANANIQKKIDMETVYIYVSSLPSLATYGFFVAPSVQLASGRFEKIWNR